MNNTNDNYQLIDLNNWPRKEHFEFFQGFEQPYFNVCCNLNAEILFSYCQKHKVSFFYAYVFLAMKSFNAVENLRYRIVDNEVRIYEKITISITQMADDDTFRFSDIPFADDFLSFQAAAKKANEKAKNENFLSEQVQQNQQYKNTVYMTVIPWISFTGFKHARQGKDTSGVPRFVFGKINKTDYTMPISIEVHHSLVDGLHVGKFVETIQQLFKEPEKYFSDH